MKLLGPCHACSKPLATPHVLPRFTPLQGKLPKRLSGAPHHVPMPSGLDIPFSHDAWPALSSQAELPKRLARRLMDLQLLPYIVVNNPNIKRVVS